MATSGSLIVTAALKAGSPPLRVAQGLRPATMGLPAVTFFFPAFLDFDVDLLGAGGLRNVQVEVDAWANKPDEAEAVAEEAMALLLASAAFTAVPLPGGFTDQETDTLLFRVSRDFSIWFNA